MRLRPDCPISAHVQSIGTRHHKQRPSAAGGRGEWKRQCIGHVGHGRNNRRLRNEMVCGWWAGPVGKVQRKYSIAAYNEQTFKGLTQFGGPDDARLRFKYPGSLRFMREASPSLLIKD